MARSHACRLVRALVLLGVWCSTSSLPEDVPSRDSVRRTKQSKESNSSENLIRPLENMADRLLKSETVGVVDSITAEAIGALTRFVDGAGLAMVGIIDNLPRTIDTMADTVDGVVRTVDQLGRDVAVIVTAPARVVVEGLTPNSVGGERQSGERRSNSSGLRTTPTNRLIGRLRERRERRREILRNFLNIDDPESGQQHNLRDNSVNTDDAAAASMQRRTHRQSSPDMRFPFGTVPAPNGGLRSILNLFRPPQNRSSGDRGSVETVTAASSLARALGRSLFASQALRQSQNGAASKENGNKTRVESAERRPTVFERNFEASKTQASIDRLEKEVGSFLGRLLGTIYRNAEPIDDSLSEGIRQVLGGPPREGGDRLQTPTKTSPNGDPPTGGASPSSTPATPTTTKRAFQFRLSFDDLDPAPVRNAAVPAP